MSEFETFYRANIRMVHAIARSRTANTADAEDLVQDTFIQAWRSFSQLANRKPIEQRAWLLRVLRNLATDEWRKLKRLAHKQEVSLLQQVTPEIALRLDIEQALATLEPTDRELVVLRYLEGMNSREIGEIMEMPEGTVRRRLARCRTLLANRLSVWETEKSSE